MSIEPQRQSDEPWSRAVVATLIPRWTGGHYGYLYDVMADGMTIVSNSHDPGHDACRALFSRGKTGKLTLVDQTGVPRMSFDILRAALLIVSEEDRKGLRLRLRREAARKGGLPVREAGTAWTGTEITSVPAAADARRIHPWERDNDYPHVVLRIGKDWRVIGCRDGIQWIVQRHAGSIWRSRGYSRSKTGLQTVLGRCGLDPATADGLPEMYPEDQRAMPIQPVDTAIHQRGGTSGEEAA